jgi:EPS-associated MarR family transcriptional regulator
MQEQNRIYLISSAQKQHGMAVACQKTLRHRGNRITPLANHAKMNEEISFKLFKLLEAVPDISQRELAKKLGISLGKTNYCLKGLMEKGWLKARNFKNSNNKIAYAYMLTPTGLSEKAKITARYLKNKVHEYEILKSEIEKLRQEVSGSP